MKSARFLVVALLLMECVASCVSADTRRPARVSPTAAEWQPYESPANAQFAFLIWDSTARQSQKVRAVSLRVGRQAIPREPMRLHIYQCNGSPAAGPGADLLFYETINICPSREGAFTYDLSLSNVILPAGDFFVGLEFVVSADNFYCADTVAGYVPTGRILHPPHTRADFPTWARSGPTGWHPAPMPESRWPLYESALSVEVEPAPAKH